MDNYQNYRNLGEYDNIVDDLSVCCGATINPNTGRCIDCLEGCK